MMGSTKVFTLFQIVKHSMCLRFVWKHKHEHVCVNIGMQLLYFSNINHFNFMFNVISG